MRGKFSADILNAFVRRILLCIDNEVGVLAGDARQGFTALNRLVTGRSKERDDASAGIFLLHR